MEKLKRIRIHMYITRRQCLIPLAGAILSLTACHHNPKERRTSTMTALTARLQPVFEKTKAVCFGRFIVDVPVSATLAWGAADIPLGVSVYPNGIDEVKGLAKKFIDELGSKKAIYHNRVPLLISVDDVVQPEGKIVVGYENFVSINALKINGYFRLNNDGVVIETRPLRPDKDGTIANINSIARRLRQRAEDEIPSEPGNCIEHAFLPDKPGSDKEPAGELIRIGFRLKEFPDAHFSIYVAPSNPHNPEGDSLEAQFKRIKADPMSPEEKKVLASTKFFRESPRQIHDWHTGYEVLMRSPDEKGSHSHHDFQIKFTGVPNDPLKPYADIQFQTGVADNAAGATKASVTDEEALAIWDKITSTIRVRPTSANPVKTAGANSPPQLPLGELAATGRTCPQTGWWQATEPGKMEDGGRQHIKAGDRMPHVVSQGEPSVWQKLKGERPSYRMATVWKLVSYDDAPARAGVTAQAPTIAQASTDNIAGKDSSGGTAESSGNDETSPKKKG
jgi:hypothetical protein